MEQQRVECEGCLNSAHGRLTKKKSWEMLMSLFIHEGSKLSAKDRAGGPGQNGWSRSARAPRSRYICLSTRRRPGGKNKKPSPSSCFSPLHTSFPIFHIATLRTLLLLADIDTNGPHQYKICISVGDAGMRAIISQTTTRSSLKIRRFSTGRNIQSIIEDDSCTSLYYLL